MSANRESMRRLGVLALSGMLLASLLAGCGADAAGDEGQNAPSVEQSVTQTVAQPQTDAAAEEAEQNVPEADTSALYHVGDSVMDGDLKITYVASGEYVEENSFMQPEEGNRYIFLRFAFENGENASDSRVSSFDFSCFADGYAADAYYGADDNLSATLSAGRSTTGSVCFEVPVNAENIEVEYEINYFSDKKLVFCFDGEQDSGYVPAQSGAEVASYVVGDTVEDGSLKITYLSCEEYISDNMFLQPEDGFRYVKCEFEFENTGKSDELVSSFSFDCYADGKACEQSYVADDTLSATLSGGRKTKGSVTFEVPQDAVNVEVEYLANYWTSSRLVFSANP